MFKADTRGRSQILKILEAKGFEVIAYDDPTKCALQTAHDCRCADGEACADILITDLDIQGLSGLDFIESQKGKGCKAQYIALMSATWASADIRRAEAIGCTIFEKPTRKSVLEQWLESCEERINLKTDISDWFIQ